MVNGLGLGNSTRCHAVIQKLHSEGATISVSTSGNGLWYFKGRPEIENLTELKALTYGATQGKISISKTILSLPRALATLKHNSRILMQALEESLPDVVVSDSEYSFHPFKKLGIPMVSLNNSDVVVQSFRQFSLKPPEIFTQFYTIEQADFFYHKWVPDKVLSPTLMPLLPGIHKNFQRISPIVRKDCIPNAYTKKITKVAIMLSGSAFGSPVQIKDSPIDFEIDILGRDAPRDMPKIENIRYHSRVKDSVKILSSADVVVINGGFSAISEAFIMKKPVIVIPVPRHAEQWVNGKTIENFGVGLMASETNFEATMFEVIQRIDSFREAYTKIPNLNDGAKQASEEILRLVR